MNRKAMIATTVGFVSLAASIIVPSALAVQSRTERETACVTSGGEWINVPNTTKMECRR